MATNHSLTSPEGEKAGDAALKAAAVNQGVASKYWLEIISIPPGNNNRLWLFVNNTWTYLAKTTDPIQDSVQNAFNNGSNLQVAVWYDTANAITGLVVRTP